jgi:putative glutamine amidotransferase
MDRPVIAITGPARGAFGPRALVALAVRLYGGRALQVRPGDDLERLTYHGVIVTGGHDVEPVLYAAEPEVEPNYDPARDALEMAVIRAALAAGVPLLGICRGAQLLNVCRGGTLFQELRSRRRKTSHRWTVLPLKTLCVRRIRGFWAGSWPCCRRHINSLHNQAIDRVGEGLRVSGRDLDGIVQAIEDPEAGFLLGVQWHPEFLLYLSRQRALFGALVAQARAVLAARTASSSEAG